MADCAIPWIFLDCAKLTGDFMLWILRPSLPSWYGCQPPRCEGLSVCSENFCCCRFFPLASVICRCRLRLPTSLCIYTRGRNSHGDASHNSKPGNCAKESALNFPLSIASGCLRVEMCALKVRRWNVSSCFIECGFSFMSYSHRFIPSCLLSVTWRENIPCISLQ